MVWNGVKDDFSIFHTGSFIPFHFHSMQGPLFLASFSFPIKSFILIYTKCKRGSSNVVFRLVVGPKLQNTKLMQ